MDELVGTNLRKIEDTSNLSFSVSFTDLDQKKPCEIAVSHSVDDKTKHKISASSCDKVLS